ncbi:MAG TPA: ribbon-helix-helix domain-containing protein [Nostocaceae cyanobacterium]|nr:ribbon-helix-helix domain-containing protein [Nostocaceae cyanobacterium]
MTRRKATTIALTGESLEIHQRYQEKQPTAYHAALRNLVRQLPITGKKVNQESKRVSFHLGFELRERLDDYCQETGKTMTEVMRELIIKYDQQEMGNQAHNSESSHTGS